MKVFFKKIGLLCLALLVFGGVCNLAFYCCKGRMTPAYTDRFINAPDCIQVTNLGSSHGQNDFCYEHVVGGQTANLGFGSQSLQYDLRVLKNYIDRFEAGSVCYIPVSYQSFILSDEESADFLTTNRRYYFFLPRKLIVDFSWREWLTAKLPGLFIPNWFAQYWETDELDTASVQLASSMNVQSDAEEAIQRHILNNRTEEGYAFLQENIDYLLEIIHLCKEHDVTPILVTTPFLREYNALVPDDFLQQQQAVIDTISAEEQVAYLDFSRDKRFIDSYELFLNSDHLNKNGALVFTDLLLAGGQPEE